MLSFGYGAGIGLLVKAITEANGWGREIISIALAVQSLCCGIMAVFAGGLADRFGNVKVVIAGTVLYGIVFLGHQVGSFIGVWPVGWLHDRSGSYDLVWWLGAGLGIMAAILHRLMSERLVKRLAAENH